MLKVLPSVFAVSSCDIVIHKKYAFGHSMTKYIAQT